MIRSHANSFSMQPDMDGLSTPEILEVMAKLLGLHLPYLVPTRWGSEHKSVFALKLWHAQPIACVDFNGN